jgi:hypothetical protein
MDGLEPRQHYLQQAKDLLMAMPHFPYPAENASLIDRYVTHLTCALNTHPLLPHKAGNM